MPNPAPRRTSTHAPLVAACAALLASWSLFIFGRYVALDWRQSSGPLAQRVAPAAVALGFGGLVLLSSLLAARARRWAGFLVLLAAAVALASRSCAEFLLLGWLLLMSEVLGRAFRGAEATEADGLADSVLSVSVGSAVLTLPVLLLGYAGWLYRGALYAVLLGLSVLLRGRLRTALAGLAGACLGSRRAPAAEADGFSDLCLSLSIALLAMSAVAALAPEVSFDALAYHLPVGRIFAQEHRFVEIPEITPSYGPMNGSALYAAALLLSGAKLAKLLHFGFGLLLVSAVYAMGRRYYSRAAGAVAALMLLSLPLVFWELGTAYTDLATSFYCLSGVWLFIEAADRRRGRDLLRGMGLSGLAFGAALGFKPLALALMAPLATAFVAAPEAEGRPRRGGRAAAMAALWAVAALVSFHWYLRAYLYTGNPLFPYFNSIFHSPFWKYKSDLTNLAIFGMGRKPLDIVLLPWNLTFHPGRFVECGNLGMMFLAFLPLLPYARRQSGATAWLALGFAGFAFLWLSTGHYARHLILPLPLLAIVYAAAIVGFCRRWKGRPLARLIRVVLVAAAAWQAASWFPLEDTRFPYRVALGLEPASQYLAREVPAAEVWAYANEHLSERDKVFSFGEERVFFRDGRVTPWGWYSAVLTGRSPECEINLFLADRAYQELLRCGYSHVMLNREHLIFQSDWIKPTILAREPFLGEFADLEHVFQKLYLYRLRKPRMRA